jgi:hypothetical protein
VESQIGVGGSEDYGHHEAEQHGAECELLHGGAFGNERAVLRGRGEAHMGPIAR